MKIAVIGAGVSGLTTAYLLSRRHDVRLFEKNAYFGGHANTVAEPESGLGLDTGFVVYNEAAYPRFSHLLSELEVPTQPSDMSFSVSCRACRVAYSSRGLTSALGSPRGLLNAEGLRFGRELWRFFRHASDDLRTVEVSALTLGEYLQQRNYGDAFRRHFLVPLAAAVWSMPPGLVESFPAAFFLRFMHNHGLIGRGGGRWRWRTVTGGSRAYVRAILDRLGCGAVADTPVREVRRTFAGVSVAYDGEAAGCERFDAVVVACHADEARALLVDATDAEAEALDCFDYSRNRVVLHTDATFLPAREAVRASWNYVTPDCRREKGALSMTYHLNRLQALPSTADFCVTVNPRDEVRPGSELATFEYSHPAYTFRTLRGQELLRGVNGRDRIFFAGAHLGYGFHEDGVESAYQVAALLESRDA